MRLCLQLPELDTQLVKEVCSSLASYNSRTWTCGPQELCLAPPWSVQYREPRPSARITLHDAVTLMQQGWGACGEMAAAYAGWMLAQGLPASIDAMQTSPNSWHVWARLGDRIYDPIVIGSN